MIDSRDRKYTIGADTDEDWYWKTVMWVQDSQLMPLNAG
jgi:hypothetical protein